MACPTRSMTFLNMGRFRMHRRDTGQLRAALADFATGDPAVAEACRGLTGPVRVTLKMHWGGTVAQTHQEELVAKVTAHVNQHFSGNWRAAFDAYDTDHNGFVSAGELRAFLMACGIGNLLSRGRASRAAANLWVSGVMREVDANGDAQISWDEFAAVLKPEDVSETGPNRVI